MGEHLVGGASRPEDIRAFTRAMLDDYDALETLLREGRIEEGPTRFGAEQEMFLVGEDGRPAAASPGILQSANDSRLTTELGTYNLEANLPPGIVEKGFLSSLENGLHDVMAVVRRVAAAQQVRPLLTGILPTLSGASLSLDFMAPEPRYRELNANLLRQRGGSMQVFIRGVDQFHRQHDNVMLEAANASFQLHLQVAPARFATLYNRAQLISAPLIAMASSSPILLGRRLWHETRVALFEAATDERSPAQRARGQRARVGFGSNWLSGSMLEVFRADLSRFPVLLTRQLDEKATDALADGRIPKLRALGLHNGTVWRWNRACFGATDESAHVRIENRVLPAGPSIVDEVANAALFYGLMLAPDERFRDIAERMPFDQARAGFIHASRYGIDAMLPWLDGQALTVEHLMVKELLPAAREGLTTTGMGLAEIDKALEPVEGRLRTGRSGAKWMLEAFDVLCSSGGSRESASRRLVDKMLEHQHGGEPVCAWPLPEPHRTSRDDFVRQRMQPIDTVQPLDALELAKRIMEWNDASFVAVEDADGKTHGVLCAADVAAHLDRPGPDETVASSLQTAPEVPPSMTLHEAAELLDTHPCLLVISDGRLIGHVTKAHLQG